MRIGTGHNLGVNAVSFDSAGTGLTLTSPTVGFVRRAYGHFEQLSTPRAPTTTTLNYNQSSDINSLTSLGISVNNDGSLTFDANSLDSLLNTDYNGVVGFFQNANGWARHSPTCSPTPGRVRQREFSRSRPRSNSNTESTLNAEISKEQTYITAQQTSLTAELNQANQVLAGTPVAVERHERALLGDYRV